MLLDIGKQSLDNAHAHPCGLTWLWLCHRQPHLMWERPHTKTQNTDYTTKNNCSTSNQSNRALINEPTSCIIMQIKNGWLPVHWIIYMQCLRYTTLCLILNDSFGINQPLSLGPLCLRHRDCFLNFEFFLVVGWTHIPKGAHRPWDHFDVLGTMSLCN